MKIIKQSILKNNLTKYTPKNNKKDTPYQPVNIKNKWIKPNNLDMTPVPCLIPPSEPTTIKPLLVIMVTWTLDNQRHCKATIWKHIVYMQRLWAINTTHNNVIRALGSIIRLGHLIIINHHAINDQIHIYIYIYIWDASLVCNPKKNIHSRKNLRESATSTGYHPPCRSPTYKW